ncbi:MAG: chromosomal replication initiator protein DnaA [Desulfobacteraceae bacterium]|nr:chromosomal replication initiator protein DnaA [Desulfobacteraceae bacterium]MBC2720979.1 chromosomal replication initiator protein DnaA [Desulfobacteraceae bacterium]
MKQIWEQVKLSIKKQIPSHSYRMWIEPVDFIECKENCIVLSCANTFSKKRIFDHYGSIIKTEIKKTSGKAYNLDLEVSCKTCKKENSGFEKDNSIQLLLPGVNVRPYNGRLLRKDFTFDQFVVGNNNDFAYLAALDLSKKNSQQSSLFLLSKTGMGKSHLSQAIGHHILSQYPTERVYYITAEDFTTEMVNSFRNGSIDKFKQKYRNECDVLLLEDVHCLTGKERTQIELAFILDYLFEADKKIFFSSCYLPSDIPKLNAKLISRFSYGLISNIDPPGFRTRVRILKKKSKNNEHNLSEEVIEYLASELTADVRQLESGLIGVTAKASILGVPIDLDLAKSVTHNIIRQRKNITIDIIKKLVCKHFNISIKDIISSSRKQNFVRPRQIAIYLSRRYTDSPLQTIGKSFNRYHATAIHSIGIVERGLKEQVALQKQVEILSKKLESDKF